MTAAGKNQWVRKKLLRTWELVLGLGGSTLDQIPRVERDESD